MGIEDEESFRQFRKVSGRGTRESFVKFWGGGWGRRKFQRVSGSGDRGGGKLITVVSITVVT